jgi:hypothetical protein
MKKAPAYGVAALAMIALLTVSYLFERRDVMTVRELRARVAALEREVAALKSGPTADEQLKRFTELTVACADRAAKKYALTDDQRKSIVEVLLLGREKIDGIMSRLAEFKESGDVDGMATAMNREYEGYKTWRSEELAKRMGSELAERVNQGELEVVGDFGRFEQSRQAR